jgi:hypothetical protein
MAGLISIASDRLLLLSGKEQDANALATIKAEVLGVIDDLNERFHWGVLAMKTTKTFSGGSSGHTISLPNDFASMRDEGIGEYDSTNDRIKIPWYFITQKRFHRMFAGVMSLRTTGTGQQRYWFFIEDDSGRSPQIRAYPSPSSSMEAMIMYYASLTSKNIDRLGNSTILVDGAIYRLKKWFTPEAREEARKSYEGAIIDRKQKRKSTESGVRPLPNIRIRRRNYLARQIK